MRWLLKLQLLNVETKLKELQPKKAILAQIAKIEWEKEKESLKELYSVVHANGITKRQYDEVLRKSRKI